jgi:hypothetical protein
MNEEPSHVKQLSLNHVCKIGLILTAKEKWICAGHSDQLENHRYHQRHLTPENVTRDTAPNLSLFVSSE